MLLGVTNKTSKMYGELVRTHLQASIDQDVLNFGTKIVGLNANDKNLSTTLYHVIYKLNKAGLIKSEWNLNVKNCSNNCYLYNHWITEGVPNINQLKKCRLGMYTH